MENIHVELEQVHPTKLRSKVQAMLVKEQNAQKVARSLPASAFNGCLTISNRLCRSNLRLPTTFLLSSRRPVDKFEEEDRSVDNKDINRRGDHIVSISPRSPACSGSAKTDSANYHASAG
eukprot:767617-Hanusia_phi.AAC.7